MRKEEQIEQIKFVNRLDKKWLLFTATAQSTFAWTYHQGQKIKSFSQILTNKAMWVKKWFPDLVIWIKAEQSKYWEDILLFIEMKKVEWWSLSPQQKERLSFMNLVVNVEAQCCHWYAKAVEFVQSFLI